MVVGNIGDEVKVVVDIGRSDNKGRGGGQNW